MSNQHGGQRPNAGRHPKMAFEISPDPQTPLEWLWKMLTELLGQESTDGVSRQFNAASQAYQKRRLEVQRASARKERNDGS